MTGAKAFFSLYGFKFRWLAEGSRPAALGSAEIALVEASGRFPVDGVEWFFSGKGELPSFGSLAGQYAYHFEAIASFLIPADGEYVRVFLHPDADPWAFQFVLSRGVIPRVLHLRGVPCLHASAVRVGSSVVGFLGPSGSGKSTLVAGLVAAGLPLLSDDVLPLRVAPESQTVVAGPGLAELRLCEHALRIVGLQDRAFPPGLGQTKWRYLPPAAQVSQESAPLSSLFLLEPLASASPGELVQPSVPLPPAPALSALISNSFWLHSRETRALASDMICFAQVVRGVPIRRLAFSLSSRDIDCIAQLVSAPARGNKP
jgi:hypothetical protein